MESTQYNISPKRPVWDDISDEKYREYTFANATVKVKNPKFITTTNDKGHRIVSEKETVYIPPNWLKLSWYKTKI